MNQLTLKFESKMLFDALLYQITVVIIDINKYYRTFLNKKAPLTANLTGNTNLHIGSNGYDA